MSAYKQFTTQDVVITPFDATKTFSYNGDEIISSNSGIEFYLGKKPLSNDFVSSSQISTGIIYKENTTGVYNSIKQLYYTNYLSSSLGDNVPLPVLVPGVSSEYDETVGAINAPRYENYLQSTLTQSRYFPTQSGAEISVISIPSKLFGENIIPGTFNMNYYAGYKIVNITDDGNGNLISSSSIVGQIFYSHGIATLTTGGLENMATSMSYYYLTGSGYGIGDYGNNIYGVPPTKIYPYLFPSTISFMSSYRIYENQYKCTVRENEFNYTQNPSARSGSGEFYYSFVTGSSFSPYVTTMGLYNDAKELLVVGKLSQPIPISLQTDTTFIVNFDI
jgi:hypothetical protein